MNVHRGGAWLAASAAQAEAQEARREAERLRGLRNKLARAVKLTANEVWPVGRLGIRPHNAA